MTTKDLLNRARRTPPISRGLYNALRSKALPVHLQDVLEAHLGRVVKVCPHVAGPGSMVSGLPIPGLTGTVRAVVPPGSGSREWGLRLVARGSGGSHWALVRHVPTLVTQLTRALRGSQHGGST